MQSAVKFFFFRPGVDPNKEMDNYLQKLSGWEVTSVSMQVVQGTGTYVAVCFKGTTQADLTPMKLDVPE